jgi:hypothetical protein
MGLISIFLDAPSPGSSGPIGTIGNVADDRLTARMEFEARFATEDDCRAYWIKARWGGKPACGKCRSQHVWSTRGGRLFECAAPSLS